MLQQNKTTFTMNIFVSSLSFKARREDLEQLFAPYGEVSSARIIINRDTHRSRGYGFVEMPDDAAAEKAIAALNGSEHMGRTINVAVATSKANHPQGAAPGAPQNPAGENPQQ